MVILRVLVIGGLIAFATYEIVQLVKLCKEKKKEKGKISENKE